MFRSAVNLSPKDADSMSFIDLYVFIALLILETTRIYLGRKGNLLVSALDIFK